VRAQKIIHLVANLCVSGWNIRLAFSGHLKLFFKKCRYRANAATYEVMISEINVAHIWITQNV
jgi:hypothetical protein